MENNYVFIQMELSYKMKMSTLAVGVEKGLEM